MSDIFKKTYEEATGGDADAQFNLGVMYAKGEGVPQDFQKAREWWEKAAELGNAQVQYNLNVLDEI